MCACVCAYVRLRVCVNVCVCVCVFAWAGEQGGCWEYVSTRKLALRSMKKWSGKVKLWRMLLILRYNIYTYICLLKHVYINNVLTKI